MLKCIKIGRYRAMKKMRSKTVLLDVNGVDPDTYILPNHEDYEYIDICVTNGSLAESVRVYKEQTSFILQNAPLDLEIIKWTHLSIALGGAYLFNVFAVGWK